jgi:hypothetical protein
MKRGIVFFVCGMMVFPLTVRSQQPGTPLVKVRIENGRIVSSEPVPVIRAHETIQDERMPATVQEPMDGSAYCLIHESRPSPDGAMLAADLTGFVQIFDVTVPDISYGYMVLNEGNVTASDFHVYLLLSTDTSITPSDILVADYVHTLLPYTNYTSNLIHADVSQIDPGTYYLGIYADATYLISESNEDNNTGYDDSPQIVIPFPPDLTGTIDVTDGIGPDITFQYTLSNDGDAAANGFHIYFLLSSNTTISPSEDILIGDHTRNLAAHSTYQSGSYQKNVGQVGNGIYYLGLYVDATYIIDEFNETNNTDYDDAQQIFIGPFADLTGGISVGDGTGPDITYAYTLMNGGDAAAHDFHVYIVLSSDDTIIPDDILVADHVHHLLNPMNLYDSGTRQANVGHVPAGSYYVGIFVDATYCINETSETNNSNYDDSPQVVIAALPDLVIETLEVLDGLGPQIRYQCTVKNNGNTAAGESKVKFYLSSDTQISSSDHLVDSWTVTGTLSAGESRSSGERTMTVSGVPAGEYYLGAIADADGQVSESSEGNNSAYDASPKVTIPESSDGRWADLDGDGDVDIADVQMVAGRWGAKTGDANYLAVCDVDGDGDIDIVDVQMVAALWGTVF